MKPWILAALFIVTAIPACAGDDTEDATGGGAGAGTATGTGTGTETGPACSTSSSCDACKTCAEQGDCADEFMTCTANPDCVALDDCVAACESTCAGETDFEGCFDTCANGGGGCVEMFPAGINDFVAMRSCVLEEQCPSLCN